MWPSTVSFFPFKTRLSHLQRRWAEDKTDSKIEACGLSGRYLAPGEVTELSRRRQQQRQLCKPSTSRCAPVLRYGAAWVGPTRSLSSSTEQAEFLLLWGSAGTKRARPAQPHRRVAWVLAVAARWEGSGWPCLGASRLGHRQGGWAGTISRLHPLLM